MEHITYGVTSDFDWYEITNIKEQLNTLASRLDRVLAAAKQREENSHQYILHLRRQNDPEVVAKWQFYRTLDTASGDNLNYGAAS